MFKKLEINTKSEFQAWGRAYPSWNIHMCDNEAFQDTHAALKSADVGQTQSVESVFAYLYLLLVGPLVAVIVKYIRADDQSALEWVPKEQISTYL